MRWKLILYLDSPGVLRHLCLITTTKAWQQQAVNREKSFGPRTDEADRLVARLQGMATRRYVASKSYG